MSELAGLGGYATRDFLQIPSNVREFHPETANLIRKPIDQTFTLRRGRI
jgi:hypothetical protein